MDWQTFLIATFVSALFVFPGFEIFQWLAMEVGQIPPRGMHQWHGKPFLHWDHFKVQLVGDFVGLSVMNGYVFVACRQVEWTTHMQWFGVGASVAIACVATNLWGVSVKQQFAAGKFARWDWGFTWPCGKITIAGWYHLAYFFLESFVIALAVLVVSWQPVGWGIKLGAFAGIALWVATGILDAKTIGLSGGPFADPQQFSQAKQRPDRPVL